jgi:hypothetical protein
MSLLVVKVSNLNICQFDPQVNSSVMLEFKFHLVLDLAHSGKQLCRAVKLSRLVANTDGTAVQFKDGISDGESIQTGPVGHE